jgi:hypothetical protein
LPRRCAPRNDSFIQGGSVAGWCGTRNDSFIQGGSAATGWCGTRNDSADRVFSVTVKTLKSKTFQDHFAAGAAAFDRGVGPLQIRGVDGSEILAQRRA